MARSIRPLWPAPSMQLLPSLGYLQFCAAAHHRAGLLDHFLDSTLLNDRTTTLRAHSHEHQPTRALIDSLLTSTCADSANDSSEDAEAPPAVDSDVVSRARK